ncbi:hypothetical protein [Nocardioides sp. ChNu-99]|uniref:hypothetical protein n=1 Tax=Nocardioides sp. ChNu-99 TaxID=2839897 RepID=UPI00240541B7|nr:hypothetical protein [Nocardioides sp. ChNu-99]MDF9717643.1 hypothetical protein [Nocardioides sp. ChNu-99]
MHQRTVAAIGLVALLAAGCGGEQDNGAEPAPSSTTTTSEPATADTATETPSATQTTGNPADVGANALALGETRDGLYLDTTLLEVQRPMPDDNPYRTPDAAGHEWVGLNVRSCADAAAPQAIEVGWFDWTMQDAADGMYPASNSSWDDFPSPQYPTFTAVSPGSCVAGWLLVSAPADATMRAAFLNASDGTVVAEWLL